MNMRPLEDIRPRDKNLLLDMQFLQEMLAITSFFNTATNIQYSTLSIRSLLSSPKGCPEPLEDDGRILEMMS